jgi:hypothetical protein
VALDAWNRLGEKRRADRERKAAERARVRVVRRPVTMETAPVACDKADVTCDGLEDARDIATHTGQTRQDSKDADASLSPTHGNGASTRSYPSDFEAAWKVYPRIRGRSSKSKSLGAWRRIPAATRERLPAAIARYAREGREPHQECGAPAMERWLRDERWLDWLEPSGADAPTVFPGPAEIRAAVVRQEGEDFATGYLDPCCWRDLPDKAVISSNGFIVDTLRKTIGPQLERFGVHVLLEREDPTVAYPRIT